MDARLQKILDREIVYSVARQLALRRYTASAANWNVDLEEGVIRWDDDIAFRAEFLGSYALESNTWLWGWANEGLDFETALKVSRKLEQYGKKNNLREFTTPGFEADISIATVLSVVCAQLTKAAAFYNCGDDVGRSFLLLYKMGHDQFEADVTETELLQTLQQLMTSIPFHHYTALQSACERTGLGEVADRVIRFDDGQVTFDEEGRVANIERVMGPDDGPAPGSRPRRPGARPTRPGRPGGAGGTARRRFRRR